MRRSQCGLTSCEGMPADWLLGSGFETPSVRPVLLLGYLASAGPEDHKAKSRNLTQPWPVAGSPTDRMDRWNPAGETQGRDVGEAGGGGECPVLGHSCRIRFLS
ncbi:hypothetical protein AAFF_G00178080 [Aldrovandia affinis]|uniref:Uncharacterized protein n=1 Tax=Aldrovandia affinis TaxID=143900 RepID=A0AAD7RL88_9TELE|nr:hypothetical protein AAFF_G00178080 [Aldrovandia affinis]